MFQTLHEISKNLIFVCVWKYVWKYVNINVSDITKKQQQQQQKKTDSSKLLYVEWINNKVLPYSTGNYIQYPVINHNGKEYLKKKNV